MIDNSEVSVRVGSSSGTEIAHKVFDTATGGNKSFAWIDIPLNEDVDRSLLEGKKTLCFLFKTDLKNDGTNNKYIANVEGVSGTVLVETGEKQYINLKHNGDDYYTTLLLNGTYTATISNDAPDGTLIIAKYRGDELIDTVTQEINSENRSAEMNISDVESGITMKVMYWDSTDGMQPLSMMRILETSGTSVPDVPTPEPTDPPAPTKDPEPSVTPIVTVTPSPTATPALPEVTTEPTSTPAQESGTVFTVDKSGETDISKNQYKTIREALASAAEKSLPKECLIMR